MKFLRYIFPLFIFNTLFAQTSTSNYAITFEASDLSIWNPDDEFSLDNSIDLFNEGWSTSGGTGNNVTSILGSEFGFQLDARTSGLLLMNIYLDGFSGGGADIVYPVDITMDYPSDSSFFPGEEILISTSYEVNNAAELTTRFPQSGELGLAMNFNIQAGITGRMCLFDCVTIPDPNIDAGINDTLFSFDASNNEYCWLGFKELELPLCNSVPLPIFERKCEDVIPEDIEAGPFTINAAIPNTETTSSITADKKLSAEGDHKYMSVSLDVIDLLSSIPGASALKAIKGEFPLISGCFGSISYSLFSTEVEVSATNNQEIEFTPNLTGKLVFPSKVNYAVLNCGYASCTGNDSVVYYQVGEQIRFRFPCNYQHMDITPTYSLDGQMGNKTFDNYDMGLIFSALSFGIELNSVVIIPEIPSYCFNVPYPCPTWSNPGRWCSSRVCTPRIPAVESPEWSFELGPLWEKEVTIASIENVWYDEEWDIDPFSDSTATPFRITAKQVAFEIAPIDIVCAGDSTGEADITILAGDGPFTYKWSNESSDANLRKAVAGPHQLILTDAYQCQYFGHTMINEPEPITITSTSVDLACNGINIGEATINIEGGVGPYDVIWSNGSSEIDVTTSQINNLSSGGYTATIADEVGCITSFATTIEEPDPVMITVQRTTSPLCNGNANGNILIEAYGGTQPYDYLWSNGDTLPATYGLTAGTYSVIVSDKYDCTNNETITLTEPTSLTADVSLLQAVSCFNGNDGSIEGSASGGTPPYSYSWTRSEEKLSNTGRTLTSLVADQYAFFVQDKNNCSSSAAIVVPQPEEPIASKVTGKDVSCYNGNDGQATVTVTGGTPGYAYAWSSGGNTADVSNLRAGLHTVTIVDANNCTEKNYIILKEPSNIQVKGDVYEISCVDKTDGAIYAFVQGGSPPYTYYWSTGENGSFIENLDEGTYYLTVTDDSLCTEEALFSVTKSLKECFFIPNAFSPNDDGINDVWVIRNADLFPDIEVNVYNRWGDKLFESKGYDTPFDGTRNGVALPAGTYYYKVLIDGVLYTGDLTIMMQVPNEE